MPPLVATLSAALSQAHTRMALIALTIRNEVTFDYFLKETGASPALTARANTELQHDDHF